MDAMHHGKERRGGISGAARSRLGGTSPGVGQVTPPQTGRNRSRGRPGDVLTRSEVRGQRSEVRGQGSAGFLTTPKVCGRAVGRTGPGDSGVLPRARGVDPGRHGNGTARPQVRTTATGRQGDGMLG